MYLASKHVQELQQARKWFEFVACMAFRTQDAMLFLRARRVLEDSLVEIADRHGKSSIQTGLNAEEITR